MQIYREKKKKKKKKMARRIKKKKKIEEIVTIRCEIIGRKSAKKEMKESKEE